MNNRIALISVVLLFSSCKILDKIEPGMPSKSSTKKADATTSVSSETQDASITPPWSIEVSEAHRVCSQTEDCVGLYVNCSNCSLDNCEGVHKDHAAIYENQLKCDGFDGPECDYDCHPNQGLTQVVCEEALCLIKER